MGQRFGRMIAANSAATTTTPIIPYMSKQNQQQQQTATTSTLDFTSTIHNTTELEEAEEEERHINTTVSMSNGGAVSPAECNSNNNRDVNINHMQQQPELTTMPLSLCNNENNNHNSNDSNNRLLSISKLSSPGGDRQIYIKIQLAKMESSNETMTIIDNNIASRSNSYTNSDFCNNQLNMISSNISEGMKTELINLSSIATAMTTQQTDNSSNAEGISKSPAKDDSTGLNRNCNVIHDAYIEDDHKAYNSTIDATSPATINSRGNSNGSSTNSNNNDTNSNSLLPTHECNNNEWQTNHHYRNEEEEQPQYHHQYHDNNDYLNGEKITEYCSILTEDMPTNNANVSLRSSATNNLQSMVKVAESNLCCRKRRSKSAMTRVTQGNKKDNGTTTTKETGTFEASSRRCCKCSCRDAFWRILDPASSRLTNKSLKHHQQQQQCRLNKVKVEPDFSKYCLSSKSNKHNKNNNSIKNTRNKQGRLPESRTDCNTTNKTLQPLETVNRDVSHSNQHKVTVTTRTNACPTVVMPNDDAAASNELLMRPMPTTVNVNVALDDNCNRGEVIRPVSTPQFVILQCAIVNATDTTTEQPPQVSKLVAAATIIAGVSASHHLSIATSTSSSCLNNTPIVSSPKQCNVTTQLIGATTITNVTSKVDKEFPRTSCNSNTSTPIVHSQVDFRHFLVPDLERITNASFYWGKMDRYEAERLLDDKSEGTFLLRDSAQEEFLFSVSFRKYGRSLHARIEQSGHRFSFDCHDPGVYTAPTVMGLLEHYKDPTCVMFFEPMLTTPLNREFCFSLQQLCRATIVSNISTYDGISELDLPTRMKLYLKEYHYKQKLRVKPFDELSYAPSCT